MAPEKSLEKVASDIAVLYELSLAVGHFLDLQANCAFFLRVLMRRKNVGYAAVWLAKSKLPGAAGRETGTPGARLIYAHPRFRIRETELPLDHPLFALPAAGAVSVAHDDPAFAGLVTEHEVGAGTYTLFPLSNLGVLKLFSLARAAPYSPDELNALRNVISQFAVSLEGCLAHQTARLEIADRQHAERALRESEKRYRNLFDRVPVGLYRVTPRGQFLDANPAMVHMLGYASREELLTVNAADLYTEPEDRRRWRSMEEQNKALYDFEALFRRRDGALIWTQNTARAVRSAEGQVLYYEGSLRDVTEQKRAEQELRQARDELERRVSERTAELSAANARLQDEAAERARAEHLRAVLYRLSEESGQAQDLPAFCAIVHQALAELLYARHLVIALYDVQRDQLVFPYRTDVPEPVSAARPSVRGPLEYVLFTGRPFWLGEPAAREACRQAGYSLPAEPVTDWLGAPLQVGDAAFGVVAVQSCDPAVLYTARDSDLLSFVARQIAGAIRRKEAEAALRTSEERFRQMAENIREVFWLTSADGRQTIYVSPAFEQIWGRSCASLYDHPGYFADSIHPDDRERMRRAFDKITSGEFDEEYRIVRPGGMVRWIWDRAFPVRDEQGRVYRVARIAEDITARKQAEEQRHHAEAEEREMAERTNRLTSLGLLAAGVAHEVNNPLQGMLSHLGAVKRALPRDFPRQESIAMVERGIASIANLVQKLLMLGAEHKTSQGRAHCREAVDSVIMLLEHQLQRATIRVIRDAPMADPVVGIPPPELLQILLNLFINAKDAMPEGGRLEVECRVEDHLAVIRVRDSGTGIAPEDLPHIFTPFFTTKRTLGTGLGLSVAESLARAHQGSLSVESTLGRGSTFTLCLPVVKDGNGAPAEGGDTAVQPANRPAKSAPARKEGA